MNKNVFYQVVQNNNGVGFFRDKSKAEKYVNQFNTKVDIAPLRIVEREFLDDDVDDDLGDEDFNWAAWQ
jgi:hypothetical protein|tara:strand:- start:258 stop:464 length:207 start_codon:yes stop_codon:yes gene_type:complete